MLAKVGMRRSWLLETAPAPSTEEAGGTKTSTTALKMSFQRSNNYDKVRRIVAEEGRAAGNLTASGVPLKNKENKEEEEAKSKSSSNGNSRAQRINPGIHKNKKQNAGVESTSTTGALVDKGAEKSSTKDRQPRKMDQQSSNYVIRYKNLKQDMDEMYATCDSDQSVGECIKVLQLMNTGVHDFQALRDRIQLHEKLEKADAQNRPNSLAWEERKSSPSAHRIVTSPRACRAHNFGGPTPSTVAASHLSHTGPSWADRVKSSQSLPVTINIYPSKPLSAAIMAKVSPVLVSKQDTTTNDSHPHYEPRQRVQLPCPQDNARAHSLSGQPVPVEPASLEEAGFSDTSHVMEPPAERMQDAVQCDDASCGDIPSPNSPPTPPQASHDWAPSSAPVPALPVMVHNLALSLSPDQPLADRSCTLLAQGDSRAVGGKSQDAATSVPGQAEASVTAEIVLDSTEFFTPKPEVLSKKEARAVRLERPDEGMVVIAVPGEEQLTIEIQAENDNLERENEEAIASAIAEEEQLTREIQAENDYLERVNEEVIAIAEEDQLTGEIQTDDMETDNEGDLSASIVSGSCGLNMDWNDIVRDYEAREPWRQSTSWGDIVEMEPSRPPGHGIYMHEKFSNPLSRRSSIAESKKKCEERQLNAQQNRDKIREQKMLNLEKLHDRHTVVRKHREALLEERRRIMGEKQLKAEFKRELHLHAIVKKAQEEDAKVNEIAFINTLEAQNKRHDALVKQNEYEQRLMDQQEERHRRQEENRARDRAVQERKRVLEAERQAKVEEMLARRKEQELRIEQQKQEKGRAREDAARERVRDQEERMAALSAAQQEATEELQKKIQIKFDESSRRHMEQLEQRKEKAAELSSGSRHANVDYPPKLTPYERKKLCTLCNTDITSEVHLLSHTKGKRHQQAVRDNSSIQGRELSEDEVEHLSLRKYIVDTVTDTCTLHSESRKDREKQQKARKKAKKLRQGMDSRSKEFEMAVEAKAQVPDSPYKIKLQRLVKDLLKQLPVEDGYQWANNMVSGVNRTLGEISHILEKQNNADQVTFQLAGGFSALELILQDITETVPPLPLKSLCAAVNTYYLACSGCPLNCSYDLFSNKIALLVDLLLHQLKLYVPDEKDTISRCSVNREVFGSLTTGLLQTSATILGLLGPLVPEDGREDGFPDAKATESFNTHARDIISYVVSMGLIDKLSGCFLSVQGPVDVCPKMAVFLQQASALLHSMCKLCFAVTGCASGIFNHKRQDPTGLTTLLRATDLVGVVHTLYCILLHSSRPESAAQGPQSLQKPPYSPSVIQVALQGVRFVNSFALLDLSAFQSVLGAEDLSLAFRHIVSSLLGYCSQQSVEELLHEVIICVGYFTVDHPDNQATVQAGLQPSVLQKLCQLPFQYFSQPRLMKVLFPSLIAACYNNPENKLVLQQEMSCVLLATFIQDCASSENKPQGKAKQGDKANKLLDYCELSKRFPRDQWASALQFFQQK